MHLIRDSTSLQQELEVKMKVWIVSNLPVLGLVGLIGICSHTAPQLPVVVGVQLMYLPYQTLKAMVLDSLCRTVEISAQALCSTMWSSLGLISVLFWTHCLFPGKETELCLCERDLPLPSVPRERILLCQLSSSLDLPYSEGTGTLKSPVLLSRRALSLKPIRVQYSEQFFLDVPCMEGVMTKIRFTYLKIGAITRVL